MAELTAVASPLVSPPVGVYSQAIRAVDLHDVLFVSGLTARDADGSIVGEGDIGRQTEAVLQALRALVAEAGATLAHVAKITVYVRSMGDFAEVQRVRERYFTPPYPASTMIEVSRFVDPRHLIEIDAVVALK